MNDQNNQSHYTRYISKFIGSNFLEPEKMLMFNVYLQAVRVSMDFICLFDHIDGKL